MPYVEVMPVADACHHCKSLNPHIWGDTKGPNSWLMTYGSPVIA